MGEGEYFVCGQFLAELHMCCVFIQYSTTDGGVERVAFDSIVKLPRRVEVASA
jgi:hypothetical protein